MRINWYIPVGVRNCGGVAMIYDYANKMDDLGHDVKVIISTPNNFTWFPLKPELIYNPKSDPEMVPDGDIVIFSNVKSAAIINHLPDEKGVKFDYVQDYEIWANSHEEIVRAWLYPIKKIAVASYLKDRINEKTGQEAYLLPYGIEFARFGDKNLRKNGELVVGALYNSMPRKRFNDLLSVFSLVKSEIPSARLVLIGSESRPELPFDFEYYEKPDQSILADIYSKCHFWCAMSEQEGLHIPPMEAMKCGSVLVCTQIGGMTDYAIKEETALTVEVGNCEKAARNIVRLHKNKDLYLKLQKNGEQKILEMGSRLDNVKKMLDVFQKELTDFNPCKSKRTTNRIDYRDYDIPASENEKVIFFGFSKIIDDLITSAKKRDIEINALSDNKKAYWGMTYRNIKMIAPEEINALNFDSIIITCRWEAEINELLSNILRKKVLIKTLNIDWSE